MTYSLTICFYCRKYNLGYTIISVLSKGLAMFKVSRFLFVIFFVNFSSNLYAQGLYISAETGAYVHFNLLSSLDFGEDAEYKAGANTAINLGYAFGVFHLEAMSGSLGDTGFDYSSDFEYKRETSYMGIAARWKWRWFSFRFGALSVKAKGEVVDSSSSEREYLYDLDEGPKSYVGSLFSLGVQFPIAEKMNIYIESTGISWDQDDKELEYEEDGVSGSESLNDSQVLSILNFGFRYYF